MFVLECTLSSAGVSLLRVNCIGSRDITTVQCNYDDGALVEACKLDSLCDFKQSRIPFGSGLIM